MLMRWLWLRFDVNLNQLCENQYMLKSPLESAISRFGAYNYDNYVRMVVTRVQQKHEE